MIIAIEGLNASGKKTQSTILQQYRKDSVLFSFPRHDGPFADVISRSLRRESVVYRRQRDNQGNYKYSYDSEDDTIALRGLFALDQYEASEEIKAHDAAGKLVILDRYWPSNVCYGAEDGLPMEVLSSLSSSLPAADLYVYLDVPVSSLLRRQPVAEDRYGSDRSKLSRIRKRYIDLWHKYMKSCHDHTLVLSPPIWVIINGHRSLGDVTSQIVHWIDLIKAADGGSLLVTTGSKQLKRQATRKT